MTAVVAQERVGRTVGSAVLVGTVTVLAWCAIVTGLVGAGMAALGDGTGAEAPVRLTAPVAWTDATLPCVEGWTLDGAGCEPAASPDQWPGGQPLPVRHSGGFVARAEVDPPTAMLSAVAQWGGLVAGGAVCLILVPALRSTASGRPFARGNARRLGWSAAVIAFTWLVVTIGQHVAAVRIVKALEATQLWSPDGMFDMPTGWLAPRLVLIWWPLLIAALLGVLGSAVRRGTRLTSDTEGLV
jgi:hypothetical protein